MYRIKNIFRLFLLLPKTLFYAYAYYRPNALAAGLIEKIKNYLKRYDLHLSEKEEDRITYYIVLNRIMISSFAILRGRKLSPKEKYLGSLLGAFTPVYDDLMDEENYTHEETRAFMDEHISDASSSMQRLITFLYQEIKSIHPDISRFDTYFDKAGIAQNRSIVEQKNIGTNLEVTRDITYEKGGNFCLLFRSGLFHDWEEGEEEAIFLLGGMTQYVDDIFDLHKDVMENTYTIPAKILSVPDIRTDYRHSLENCYQSFSKLNYKKSNNLKFWSIQYLTLSRGYVALDHFAHLPKFNSIEDIRNSKKMVVDMELFRNVWKNLNYFIQYKIRNA
jgi:hypothetical protein